MTEIERTMTIDEIVKEFDELMTSRTGDSPAKRDLIRAAASLGGKFTLPQQKRVFARDKLFKLGPSLQQWPLT